jgi:O-antigen ligase
MKARYSTRVSTEPPSRWWWISHAAFMLALAVMIARLTTPDSLRDPWETLPGSPAIPSSPGPGTALVLDLLAALPAVLILIRWAFDRANRLTFHASHALLFAFTGWMLISVAWSTDRFSAAVTSADFFAAACLLWAMSQLVRSASRFRITAAVAFGLLMVLVVQSAFYRWMDVPANIQYWNEKKADILKEHNWAPDSFAARQFEHKLVSGELVGFFNSANTFAAVGVLLFAACVGVGFQKWRDGEPWGWLLLPLVAAISLVWILVSAASKASGATPILGLLVLALFFTWRYKRPPISRRDHSIAFSISLAIVVFAMIAIVARGLHKHGLFTGHFSNSLDFRWKYWVASAGIFLGHPLIGIGWSNFSYYYLAHRLPEAAEEIKDPHNFLVRIFVELGMIGGFLAVSWLLRLAWETTSPAIDQEKTIAEERPMTLKTVAVIVLLGMLLNIAANIDFTMPAVEILSLLRLVLYLLALLMGAMAAAMLSEHSWSVDARPAPVIFYCTVTGLGLFLVQNLIDFSWFEAGALFLFMALLGSALGMAPAHCAARKSQPIAITGAAVGAILWLAAAVCFVFPVLAAEDSAANANEIIRTAPQTPSPESRTHFLNAADALGSAAQWIPYNSDYTFREAEAFLSGGDLARGRQLLARTQQINPMQLDGYLLEANLQLGQSNPDVLVVRRDFDTVLRLNPNDVSLHEQYARALQRFGLLSEAREQYRAALEADDALPAGEPKRLSANDAAALRARAEGSGEKP